VFKFEEILTRRQRETLQYVKSIDLAAVGRSIHKQASEQENIMRIPENQDQMLPICPIGYTLAIATNEGCRPHPEHPQPKL
jgi:hypothetical protein